tara:strand:- start:9022 stop:9513 length:492 start_codon:yes stop_codon:yes gene_type:complete
MINKKWFVGLSVLCSVGVNAECRSYTQEQRDILDMAYIKGGQHGYELSLPAIIEKESFVGNQVLRANPDDPSYGVTHITFNTLRWLSGKNRWDAIKEAENIIKDDGLAMDYAIQKLLSVHSTTYWAAWRDYNGRSKAGERYANDIQGIIRKFKRCNVFDLGWG